MTIHCRCGRKLSTRRSTYTGNCPACGRAFVLTFVDPPSGRPRQSPFNRLLKRAVVWTKGILLIAAAFAGLAFVGTVIHRSRRLDQRDLALSARETAVRERTTKVESRAVAQRALYGAQDRLRAALERLETARSIVPADSPPDLG